MTAELFDSRAGDAVFSRCGRYRYRLTRFLGGAGSGRVVFVMLNPSTADGDHDDPTIRRCVGFAKSWGLARLDVVNLFAWRATNPRALAVPADPIGPDNDRELVEAFTSPGLASRVICAWGQSTARVVERQPAVIAMIRDCGVEPEAFGLTRAGTPGHPLYTLRTAAPVTLRSLGL